MSSEFVDPSQQEFENKFGGTPKRRGMRKVHKEILRYVILIIVFTMTWELSMSAYGLEVAGKLTMQFAGIVASAWGATTLILKFMFDTEESDT